MGSDQNEVRLFFEQLEAYYDEFALPNLPSDSDALHEPASLSEDQVAKLSEDLQANNPDSKPDSLL